MATVCIGLPTRNRPAYVKHALDSILNQTFRDFRVIVSDDASEPRAAREVEDHVRDLKDPRVSYRYHLQNLKEYHHGRALFAMCSEDYFAILHDDDLWDPPFLERCVDILMRDESVACVTANQYIIDETGRRQADATVEYQHWMGRDRHGEGRLPILEPLLSYSFLALSSTVFRTAALTRSSLVDPGYEGNGIFDLNVFLRLGERGEQVYYIPDALAAYRIHQARLTVTEYGRGFNPNLLKNFTGILEARRFSGTAERERRRHLSAAYHNYAIVCYLRHDIKGMYRYVIKSLQTGPWRWQNWAYAVFAVVPWLIKPVFKSRVPLSSEGSNT